MGARSATAYGEMVATEMAAGLGERGFTVVSGAAFGIDAAAHRGALATGDGRPWPCSPVGWTAPTPPRTRG